MPESTPPHLEEIIKLHYRFLKANEAEKSKVCAEIEAILSLKDQSANEWIAAWANALGSVGGGQIRALDSKME